MRGVGMFQPIKIPGVVIALGVFAVWLRPRESGEMLGTKTGQLADGLSTGAENFQRETSATTPAQVTVNTTAPVATAPATDLLYTCPVEVPQPWTVEVMESYGCVIATPSTTTPTIAATITQPTTATMQQTGGVSWPKMGAGVMCFAIAGIYVWRMVKVRRRQKATKPATETVPEDSAQFATAGFPTSQNDDGTWVQPNARANDQTVIDATCTEADDASEAA